VPVPDDERFEAYLKQFRPLVPDPLPRGEPGRPSRHSLVLRAWLAAVAILLIAAIGLRIRSNRVAAPETGSDAAIAERSIPPLRLTMRSANALLATAPSYKAAVDTLAFQPREAPLAPGQISAITVLRKERIKL
jgi:hypothetical protein